MKKTLYFLKRELESNQEINLQAVDWLLLLNNMQNYCYSEFMKKGIVSCFFCWFPNPV